MILLLLKRNNNFCNNKVCKKKKKNPPPLNPQKWLFLEKNPKKFWVSNFRSKKNLSWCLSMLKNWFFMILSQWNENYKTVFKIKIGYKLTIWQGKTWSVVDRKQRTFFLFPYNLAFFSPVRMYVIGNNNFLLKISNPMTFSNFMYIENWSVSLFLCPTDISGGCHKSRHTLIYLPSWQLD